MQKFKFKLHGLLKLREFKEHQVKLELGHLNRQINLINAEIREIQRSMEDEYEASIKLAAAGTKARMLQFFPMSWQAKRAYLQQIKAKKESLSRQVDDVIDRLNKAHGEYKAIQNIEEKQATRFKKEQDKKIEKDIEDLVRIRNQYVLKKDETP